MITPESRKPFHTCRGNLIRNFSSGILTGDSAVFPYSLKQQILLYIKGFEVFNLDCAMRFDVFSIMEEAARYRVPYDELLNQILVQRAFTPYQILDSIHNILGNRSKSRNRIHFLLAPAKQFYDGDVSTDEARYLLKILFQLLARMKRYHIPFLFIEKESYGNPIHPPFMESLQALTGKVRIIRRSIAENTKTGNNKHRGIQHGTNSSTILQPDRYDQRSIERFSQSIEERRTGTF